ncbi:phage tail protein [Raoultella lignicola]|uniref:Phage tail protein n=1 Tax=Raoultella lignicola TaxID=3040939 RepID=A0ABU9F9B8_9ENTR
MSAIITRKYEQWAAGRAAQNLPARPDTFVFAYIPGQDPGAEISRDEPLPPQADIVHTAPVMQYGMLNTDAVVFSVVMDTTVGDFDYNWIGLLDQASNTLCMIVHTRTQRKIATIGQAQGNTLTRTLAMEFNGAAGTTQINVTPQTWQIDFSARLYGVDERQRLAGLDIYGAGAFFGDSFLITHSGETYQATAGIGYVGGLRALLPDDTPVDVASHPTIIWADASFQGQVTSRWETKTQVVAADVLQDYIDPQGFPHYVTQLARINEDGSVTDLRPKGSSGEQEAERVFLRKDQNLKDVSDKADARKNIDVYSKEESNTRFVNQDGDDLSGELVSMSADNWRMVGGRYGVFWRHDGSNYWLMLTDADDQRGSYNDLRPLQVNVETGLVTVGSGLMLAGAAPMLQLSTGTKLHPDGNIEGTRWGGFLSNWLDTEFTNTKNFVYQNYLAGVQLGARQVQDHIGDLWPTPAGCVITGMSGDSDNDIATQYAPIQVLRNGVWATIAG